MSGRKLIPFRKLIRVQSLDEDVSPENDQQGAPISKTKKALDISGQNVTRLLPAFGRLNNITRLQMNRNGLESLPSSFGKLTNLVELGLATNKIRKLPASFAKLTKLKSLHLYSNRLKKIPIALTKLTSLEHLDMDNNPLQSDIVFPQNWSSLKLLSFVDCNQYTISPTINNLVNIVTLSIGENYWKTFPSLEGLGKIMELSMNQMKAPLHALPDSIKCLETLIFLACNNSGLRTLPDWLPSLRSLKTLELTDNCLAEIPSSIGNMQSLTDLELANNHVSQIPKAIARIKTLYLLDLSENPIASFPMALYERNPELDLIADDLVPSALEESEPIEEKDNKKKATQPQRLEVQVARMLARQKVKLTQADLPPSCLELINSARECSTLDCNGIFIRGGGIEESSLGRFSIHIDDFWNHPVLVDKHTCDFQCTNNSPQNRI